MANAIIGTSGHIDHGKTSLIKRLSGIDTDRLKEEKKRGITIELGFAYFDLPSGKRVGIVDVPGHERFIKNMLAGASGIDLVLLVISAEDGFMPQTQEHFDILTLLDIKKGIIVLTKCDLVDQDWIGVITEDIREKVKGSFLEDAEIVQVSSFTGEGMDKLTAVIDHMLVVTKEKNENGAARLPIDRVFTMTGFGTVVTGTLLEGVITEGDILQIYPSGIEARVRKLQVHGKDEKIAYAGQRVAVNIANVSKDDIDRGEILAEKNSMHETSLIDAKLKLLSTSHRTLSNWSRLRLYHGSREVFCRLVLLDREELKPGEEAFVQLRLEEQTACKYGDRFVIRLYSPLETIGGGVILDSNAIKHKRFDEATIEKLHVKAAGDQKDLVSEAILKSGGVVSDMELTTTQAGLPKELVAELVDQLVKSGEVYLLDQKYYMHMDHYSEIEALTLKILKEFHDKKPLKKGMGKEELKSKLPKLPSHKVFDEYLDLLRIKEMIEISQNLVRVHGFEVVLSGKSKQKVDHFIDELMHAGFNPPNVSDICLKSAIMEKDKDMMEYLLEREDLIILEKNIWMHRKWVDQANDLLKAHFLTHDKITMGEFRDLIGSSRKIALPLLEYFDTMKITKRVEEYRVLQNEEGA